MSPGSLPPYTAAGSYALCAYASGSAALVNIEVTRDAALYSQPKFTYKPYSKQIVLGDGSVRGAGWAVASWSWDVMSRTQRDWLRAYCTGQSSDVWIRTKTLDSSDAYVVRRAVMIWPIDSEEHDVTRRTKFEIKFQNLRVS